MSNLPKIVEPKRELSVIGKWDVVVCGGGPSGFIAATASARNGAKTLLIEEHGFLGGMATAALVGPISKFNFDGNRIVGGIPLEFILKMEEKGGAITNLPSGNIPFDPEIYKHTALQMVKESGAELLLHTRTVNCLVNEKDKGTVDYVIVESPSGREAIQAKFIIDATGTGTMASRAGFRCKLRTDNEGRLQPLSLVFRLGGVDTDNLRVWMDEDGVKYANVELKEVLQTAVEKGKLKQFGGPWTVFGSTIRRGEVSVNATRFAGNAIDRKSFTEAEVEMRKDVMKMIEIFRKASSQFANCYLIDTATQAGIRETRMIEGLYTIDLDDILNPKDFPDTVAKGAHWIDIHQPQDSKQSATFVGKPYNIPYRTLIPLNSQNLIVAGGSISATKEAFASIRVQAQCMALGQAAGTAAAICTQQNISAASIDVRQLREILKDQEAII